jgi:hypothetical protein
MADDAISHFRFRKPHLQEVADKLWPRLREYLAGSKTFILFNNGNYSAPYETLFLMLLFRFSRPRRIRKEMESFFCYRRSKISAGIRAMADALYALSICYLDNPRIYHERMAYYAERVYAKCGLVQSVWGFIDGTLRKTCRPSFFRNCSTAVTNELMESSSSLLCFQTGFLLACLGLLQATDMVLIC